LAKNGPGYIFGDFFENSSGHDEARQSPAEKADKKENFFLWT
jgi:hypothetical protein